MLVLLQRGGDCVPEPVVWVVLPRFRHVLLCPSYVLIRAQCGSGVRGGGRQTSGGASWRRMVGAQWGSVRVADTMLLRCSTIRAWQTDTTLLCHSMPFKTQRPAFGTPLCAHRGMEFSRPSPSSQLKDRLPIPVLQTPCCCTCYLPLQLRQTSLFPIPPSASGAGFLRCLTLTD